MGKIKAMLPPLTMVTISYYVLLSLLLRIGEMEVGSIILLVAIPLCCLGF